VNFAYAGGGLCVIDEDATVGLVDPAPRQVGVLESSDAGQREHDDHCPSTTGRVAVGTELGEIERRALGTAHLVCELMPGPAARACLAVWPAAGAVHAWLLVDRIS
jgi:hypothetical protein